MTEYYCLLTRLVYGLVERILRVGINVNQAEEFGSDIASNVGSGNGCIEHALYRKLPF
jgi:hypothetical protein